MVARVFGRIDGIEVNFKQEGDSYVLEFPKKIESGNYIVEVYAEDEAGNVSYCSTLICAIDPSGACVHLAIAKFYLYHEEPEISLKLIRERTYLEAIPPRKCRGG